MIPDPSRFLRLGIVGSGLLAAVACGDAASSPKPPIRTNLVAASPTGLTGTVGAAVDQAPSVIVRDSSGRPVAGIVVAFTITDGGGYLPSRLASSGADGLARLERWTLGMRPGRNELTATTPTGASVVFVAEAAAGPPSHIQKVGGDGQVGQPGEALPAHPRVMITDAFDNPLAGVTVTFAVEAGGGSVARSSAVTNSLGTAESGAWFLGTSGAQRMVASAGSLVAEPFAARVIVPPDPCAVSGNLQPGITTRAELSSLGCNVYTIVVPAMATFSFNTGSPDFDTNLQLRGADLMELAGNDNVANGFTSSAFTALLAPGTYTLYVTSSKPGTGGTFDVVYTPSVPDPDGCDETFVVRGVAMRGVVYSLACAPEPFNPADRFRVYLAAGQRIDIQVEDFSYSGPRIRVIGPDGGVLEGSYTAPYITSIFAVAPVDGYYVVMVGLVNESGVTYEMKIR